MPNEAVAEVEDDLMEQVLKANEEVDEAIVQAETLMKAHGITLSVTDTPNCSPPFCHSAEIAWRRPLPETEEDLSPSMHRPEALVAEAAIRSLDPEQRLVLVTIEYR